jgi:mannose-1-phosphate guanylyltransferase
MIPALVLTAGLATRLRPLSMVRAKAALPVAGEALARRILRALSGVGVTDAVLNLHHLPHTLTREIGDGSDVGVRVRYSWEVPVLGSAGGPRRALKLLPHSRFLVVNGDTLTNLHMGALVAQHEETRPLVTMAVVPNSEPQKYGGVLVDGEGIVTGFVRRGSTQPSHHFIGVQVTEAAAFASVPENVPYESVTMLYPALTAARRDAVRAFIAPADFHDIGTPADYLATAMRLSGGESQVGRRTAVAGSARLERSILWDDVQVEAGAVLRGCVVTDHVCVPANTRWEGVILRPAATGLTAGDELIGDLAVTAL